MVSENPHTLTRFAPSPTGYLHLGHARAALEAFRFGPCLLRIEDIDQTRCKPAFTDAIYEDLTWLGLSWPTPVRVQSQHMDAYQRVIHILSERGLAYPCFKTRREWAAKAGPLPAAVIKARTEAGHAYAWRLNIKACRDVVGDITFTDTGTARSGVHPVDWARMTDEIIARKDIGASYHLCVTHDDAVQGMTHIVRGVDLFDTTPFHRVLQSIMGWPEPIYVHHPVLLNKSGQKLSKRNKDTTLRSLRADGLSPSDVLDMAFAECAG